MAGKVFISNIKEGDDVEGVFLTDNVFKRTAKNKKTYLKLYLSDKTGAMESVAWDEAMAKNPDCSRLKAGDFISLSGQGRTNRYTNKVELIVSSLNIIALDKIELTDLLPSTDSNIEGLEDELLQLRGKISDPYLNKLLENLFADKKFRHAFVTAPAAKNYHHAYLGGLLEHSVSVTNLVNLVCSNYPDMDKSLLLTGAILHDVGKIKEFEYERKIDYSTVGRLIGHIVIGNQIVSKAMDEIPDFPEDTKFALSHLILSHHGEPAYGAAVRPKTKEAVVLSILDNVDAKVNGFMRIAKGYGDEVEWTEYQSMFEDYLYLGPRESKQVTGQMRLVDE